jgi:hypothetical protein
VLANTIEGAAMENVATRRGVLAGAGVAGAAAGLAAIPVGAAAASPSVRGTWLIKPTTGASPAGFRALAAFAAGGVFVTTGSDEAGTGLGQWTGGGTSFGFTYLNFHFDSAGKPANTVKVRAKGTFKGSKLSGHATLTTFDPNGLQIGATRLFDFTGNRVRVEVP